MPTLENSKTPVLEIQDLHYTYPDGTDAIKGINLNIFQNDFVAIIGQNGSGKTTLVKHFNGLYKPSQGQIRVKGQNTRDMTVAQLSQNVGYVFQNPDHMICCGTVQDEVAFGLKNLEKPEDIVDKQTKAAMDMLGLTSCKEQHPLFLSKGERQRVAVASILAMQPEIFIIDEPTTGQNHRQSRQMMEMVKLFHDQGHTVVMISHDMKLVAEYADRVIVLVQGKVLLDDTKEKVFSQPAILEQSFIKPPQITQLAQQLSDIGFPTDILFPQQMYKVFKELYRQKGGN